MAEKKEAGAKKKLTDFDKLFFKPSEDWKYATTVVRENQALKLGSVFLGRDVENTLTSPASSYPERQLILPREKLKPKR